MLQKTTKLLIGKDIARDTHHAADGASLPVLAGTSDAISDGEVLVLDKNKCILAAGATVLDTDVIYIAQGTGETFTYQDGAGSSITARKVIFSDPIEGKRVRKYTAKSYTAKAEKTAVVNLTGYTPVASTEYIVRIVYKDIKEHPGQFTQTYRYITPAAAPSLANFEIALVAKINAHKGRRVLASTDNTSITLTALEMPECCTALTDIDIFDMVDFEAFFLYVNSSGNWTTIPSTTTTVTYAGPTFGSGNWEQVRDLEKSFLGYVGVTNRTHWPVKEPTMGTVVDAYYDLVIIEHDKSYLSPDNQYRKDAPLKTIIALATASTGINAADQSLNILDRLNPWMESCGFDSVSV